MEYTARHWLQKSSNITKERDKKEYITKKKEYIARKVEYNKTGNVNYSVVLKKKNLKTAAREAGSIRIKYSEKEALQRIIVGKVREKWSITNEKSGVKVQRNMEKNIDFSI